MRLNGKYYNNIQLTSIGKNKECEWIQDCLRIAANVMFTKMSANKEIKLFKDCKVANVVK